MHRCVTNFASGAWYPKGQERLRRSLIDTGYTGVFKGFQDTKLIGGPLHSEVPYAFKTHALTYLRTHGFDSIIYADASIYAVKSWDPIWDIVEKQGWYFEAAGHYVGTWTKDSVLKEFGVSRAKAMTIPMFSAGFVGLNMQNKKAVEFLEAWHKYACDEDSFKGSWTNENKEVSKDKRCHGHRHDMSVASLLAWKMGMQMGNGGEYLAYRGKGYRKPKSTVVAYLEPC